MKKILSLTLAASVFLFTLNACAQNDKSQRPSPPATVTQKISSGATITIDYSQPSLKGRTIGKDVEPMEGQVWRAGANEATVFQTDKDVKIEGQSLPAGKYSFFTIKNGDDWTLIFNKKWQIWGTNYNDNKSEDALQVHVKGNMSSSSTEKLTYTISQDGTVNFKWGTADVAFHVQ